MVLSCSRIPGYENKLTRRKAFQSIIGNRGFVPALHSCFFQFHQQELAKGYNNPAFEHHRKD